VNKEDHTQNYDLAEKKTSYTTFSRGCIVFLDCMA